MPGPCLELMAPGLKLHSHFTCQETEAQRSSSRGHWKHPCLGVSPALCRLCIILGLGGRDCPHVTEENTEGQNGKGLARGHQPVNGAAGSFCPATVASGDPGVTWSWVTWWDAELTGNRVSLGPGASVLQPIHRFLHSLPPLRSRQPRPRPPHPWACPGLLAEARAPEAVVTSDSGEEAYLYLLEMLIWFPWQRA